MGTASPWLRHDSAEQESEKRGFDLRASERLASQPIRVFRTRREREALTSLVENRSDDIRKRRAHDRHELSPMSPDVAYASRIGLYAYRVVRCFDLSFGRDRQASTKLSGVQLTLLGWGDLRTTTG